MDSILRQYRPWLGAIAIVALSAMPVAAGPYANSAHGGAGTPANGLSRTATTAYAPGSCAHCHEQHASINGSEPSPVAGPEPYLGLALEQNLCHECHKTGGSSDGLTPPDNILSEISKTYRHGTELSDSLHRAGESFTDFTASPHVECTDCHNAHVARKGNHKDGVNYKSPSGNLIDNSGAGPSPLEGVSGAAQAYGGVNNWVAPTQGSYTLQTASKEYEICFKCHSAANANWAAWGGAGAEAWADAGLEFNPNNKSFHPVVGALNAGGSGSSVLGATQLTNSWTPGDTMYCSDCHGNINAGAVQGPHGSATKWMLTGTNDAWPYTSSANNGTSAGTFFYLGGSTTDLFCMNCHPDPTSADSNNAHTKSDHQSSGKGNCTFCHLRVPHGGKVSRLINADGGGLPARYHPDGNNGGTQYLTQFKKAVDKDSYGKTSCQASCAGDHSGAVSSPESW